MSGHIGIRQLQEMSDMMGTVHRTENTQKLNTYHHCKTTLRSRKFLNVPNSNVEQVFSYHQCKLQTNTALTSTIRDLRSLQALIAQSNQPYLESSGSIQRNLRKWGTVGAR